MSQRLRDMMKVFGRLSFYFVGDLPAAGSKSARVIENFAFANLLKSCRGRFKLSSSFAITSIAKHFDFSLVTYGINLCFL